jgi:hypothetical protein
MATKKKSASSNGKVNGIGDEAVREKTGKTWEEWVKTLDTAGGRTMAHAEIASLLHERFRVPSWWTQMVAVGYEQLTGRRVRGQKADGFAVSASKTLPVSAAAAFKAFHDARARSVWLRDEITIRKATAPKSLRITWGDGKTHVDVGIYAKGSDKTQVSLQHSKLANVREAARMKKYWGEALARLAETLT